MRKLVVFVLVCGLWLSAGPSAAQIILPPEGAELSQIHLLFHWLPVLDASGYELAVVVDNGAADPFDGNSPVVESQVNSTDPRILVKDGLAFAQPYAWRVRGVGGQPFAWGPTYRFSTVALPVLPEITVTRTPAAGPIEPGLTLFSVNPGYGMMAVDEEGTIVWYQGGLGNIGDLRLLPNGRLLLVAGGRAREMLLDGRTTWISPDDPDLFVHHEAFPMPDGNILALVRSTADVLYEGVLEVWRGDRIVEFDRSTADIVWSWDTFDHYSTLDFDPVEIADPNDAEADWTHANAVVYNAADDSVYISARHLSRITRIDYATGEIVYNMGRDMPSGDTDFGHGLFSFEHAPQLLPNGNMMVYDNGNLTSPLLSRAIELEFDSEFTSAAIVWEYLLPTYTGFVGDADRLPGGNTLVAAAAVGNLIEVGPDPSDVVWTLQISEGRMYRSERIPELVIPDVDEDGIVDAHDPCAYFANTLPLNGGGPTDPNGDPNGDGIPNECQCGDTKVDGLLGFDDATCFAQCFAGGGTAPGCVCTQLPLGKGDTNNDGLWGIDDATNVAQAFVGGIPTYALTCAARPEGTPVP